MLYNHVHDRKNMNDKNITNWLEVSLTVDGELAEAVADVLARFAPNGVATERGIAFVDDDDPWHTGWPDRCPRVSGDG